MCQCFSVVVLNVVPEKQDVFEPILVLKITTKKDKFQLHLVTVHVIFWVNEAVTHAADENGID